MEGNDSDKPKQTPVQKAFQRKVRREAYLTSGFENEKEKTRVVDIFHAVVWPKLQEIGWNKLDDEKKTVFENPGKAASFERIIDIISHVKTNESLADVAADFSKAMIDSERDESTENLPSSLSSPAARHRRRLPKNDNEPLTPSSADGLSWKYAGKEYPKQCSQVGPQYQATKLPKAGSYDEKRNPESKTYADLVWSPTQMAEKGVSSESLDALLADIPPHTQEAAIFLLAEKGYDAEAFREALSRLKPSDGSDWKTTRIKRFHQEIFRYRKDIVAVAKAMRIPIKSAYNFYLARFKFSDEYRLLKTIVSEEETQRMEMNEHETDECAICGDGGSLLICDGCEGEYHLDCLRPALARVPSGLWYCDECVDKQLISARDDLIRSTRLFELIADKRPTAVDGDEEHGLLPKKRKVQHLEYRPSDIVLAACRKMAMAIHEALTESTALAAEPMASLDDE